MSKNKPLAFISAMDSDNYDWTPEEGSTLWEPTREPLIRTLARVGGVHPSTERGSFERVMRLGRTAEIDQA